MTIRFAASKASGSSILARALSRAVPLAAANDNGNPICSDRLLKAALRHFAEHGLSATVRMQGVVPKFVNNPGKIRWAAKHAGADNNRVYTERLGLSEQEIESLRQNGII